MPRRKRSSRTAGDIFCLFCLLIFYFIFVSSYFDIALCSKNHARAMDSMQASLESEQRAKAEALRIKKKLEGDINELEIALDHANKANSEAQKATKRFQGQLRDVNTAYEEESRARQEVAEKASLADRRGHALAAELEEARALHESAERGKRQTE